MQKRVRFTLDGCDIWAVATAPEDMTVKQLVEQANRIAPPYCACGIRKPNEYEKDGEPDVIFDYDNVELEKKAVDDGWEIKKF